METYNSCKMCQIWHNRINNKDQFWYNKILFESDNFFVIPSLGSLLPGWLLIVAKNHSLCIGALNFSLRVELEKFKSRIVDSLEHKFKSPIFIFEHGPNRSNSCVGCGTDHMHLHLVPTVALEGLNLQSQWNEIPWTSVDSFGICSNYYHNNSSYYYYELLDKKFIGAGKEMSQFFRKQIAKAHHLENVYDWKNNPFHEKIRKTIELFT